jgi:hypothetical protein
MSSQATRPHTMSPTRRRFLAIVGAGAASTVAPAAIAAALAPATETPPSALAPAAAIPSPDAALLKLIDDYWTANAETDRARDVCRPLEEKYFARKRQLLADMPNALRVRPEDTDLDLPIKPADGWYGLANENGRHLASVDCLRAKAWPILDWETATITKKISSLVVVKRPSPAARARADEIIEAHDRLWKRYMRKPSGFHAADRAKTAAFNRQMEISKRSRTRARSRSWGS